MKQDAQSSRLPRREFCKAAALCSVGLTNRTLASLASNGRWDNRTHSKETSMEIKKIGSQSSAKGPAEWFTGTVRIDPLFTAPDPALVSGASVTFEPGGRTAWHTHPLGQTLFVASGCGWAQRLGGPVEEIHPGVVFWFALGVLLWLGAVLSFVLSFF